jgi:DNA-binding response OmpR family regulator
MTNARSPRTVLVIDDDPFLRAFVAAVLGNEGYTVHQAPNAVDGVAAALTAPPALILLDYAMPGNDGLEVISALKAIHGADDAAVIVFSAWQSEDVKLKVLKLGATWLDKPATAEQLVSAVRRRLAA